MKRVLFALIFALPLLAGCAGNSTSGSNATKTTLYGSLQPPSVTAAMIGQSRRAAVRPDSSYNTELLKDYVSSGTCLVNGSPVAFSLDTGNSTFVVSGLNPSGAYEVRFDLASLSLRATKAYTGVQMNMGTVNLTSTAKSLLYQQFGGKISDIQNYNILERYYSPLADKLTAWLGDPTMTPAAFGVNLTAELASYSQHFDLEEISTFIGNNMSGTWTGQGRLYTKTFDGKIGQKASVNLTLYVARATDKLKGYVNVEVVSTTKVNDGGMIPVSGKREFTATVDTEGQFSFEVCNSSLTPVERWTFTLDSTNALVCQVESLNTQGYLSDSTDLPKLRQ